MTEGLSPPQLERYRAMRARCDEELKTIQSLSSMLSLLDTCPDATLKVDPVALAHTQRLIAQSALVVLETLEDFIGVVEAKQAASNGA